MSTFSFRGMPIGGMSRHWTMPAVLLVTLAVFQPWFEASMVRHMGLELPLLFIVGWFTAHISGEYLVHTLEPWNLAGLPGLTFAMFFMSVWMVPSALDYAVLSSVISMSKVVSMFLAGVMTGASWRTAGVVVQAFFVMNWFWTTFVVGVLYNNAPQQLCSVYPTNEQADTGMFLMAWAVLGLLLWISSVFRKLC